MLRRPLGVLVVLVSQFRAALTAKLRQIHPVVVDQPDAPVSLHHHVAMLQIVVGDAETPQAGGRTSAPLGGDAPECVRLAQPRTDEPAQKLSVHPLHPDYGAPVASKADSLFPVLEVDKGRWKDVE